MQHLCDNCQVRPTGLFCTECDKTLCIDCDTRLHKIARFQTHTRKKIAETTASPSPPAIATIPCQNCESAPAEMRCTDCQKHFCHGCDERLHQRAKFLGHHRSPLSAASSITPPTKAASIPATPTSTTTTCTNCETAPSQFACASCAKSLCGDCDARLHTMPKYRAHERTRLNSSALTPPPRLPIPTSTASKPPTPATAVSPKSTLMAQKSPESARQKVPAAAPPPTKSPTSSPPAKSAPVSPPKTPVAKAPIPAAYVPSETCTNCEVNRSSVSCPSCSKSYCVTCDDRVHRVGKFRAHSRQPLPSAVSAMSPVASAPAILPASPRPIASPSATPVAVMSAQSIPMQAPYMPMMQAMPSLGDALLMSRLTTLLERQIPEPPARNQELDAMRAQIIEQRAEMTREIDKLRHSVEAESRPPRSPRLSNTEQRMRVGEGALTQEIVRSMQSEAEMTRASLEEVMKAVQTCSNSVLKLSGKHPVVQTGDKTKKPKLPSKDDVEGSMVGKFMRRMQADMEATKRAVVRMRRSIKRKSMPRKLQSAILTTPPATSMPNQTNRNRFGVLIGRRSTPAEFDLIDIAIRKLRSGATERGVHLRTKDRTAATFKYVPVKYL